MGIHGWSGPGLVQQEPKWEEVFRLWAPGAGFEG